MTCRELIDFLANYLDDELRPTARTEFERHLNDCPDCVDYLRSYEETIKLGTGALLATDDPVRADVQEDLVRAILAASGK